MTFFLSQLCVPQAQLEDYQALEQRYLQEHARADEAEQQQALHLQQVGAHCS